MSMDRLVFLLVAFATHGAVGYALVAVLTTADPRLGAIVAIAPDIDLLAPADWGPLFVHRGITHTPLFVLGVVAVAYSIRWRRTDATFALLALGSHLSIDALSPMGLPLLLPLGQLPSPGLAIHSPFSTVLLWTGAIGLLVFANRNQTSSSGQP